jgi:hypothetical protein
VSSDFSSRFFSGVRSSFFFWRERLSMSAKTRNASVQRSEGSSIRTKYQPESADVTAARRATVSFCFRYSATALNARTRSKP